MPSAAFEIQTCIMDFSEPLLTAAAAATVMYHEVVPRTVRGHMSADD